MSSRCFLCYALGDRDTEDTSVATTRSREEIERHIDIHRNQIRFMPQADANEAESGGAPKESGADNGISRNGGERRSEDPEKRNTLEDHCRAIKLKSQMRDNNGVYCNLCKSVKVVRSGQHLRASRAIRHAQVHLHKMMYTCGHCERHTTTDEAMRQHLKTQHNIVKDITDYFDAESDDHLEEIKEMITKCFEENRRESSGHQVNEVRNASVVAKSGRSKVTLDQSNRIERRASKRKATPMEVDTSNQKETIIAHCRSILPNRQRGCDAFALCNLCREKRHVYSPSGSVKIESVVRHVQFHLGRSFYFCKMCDAQFNRSHLMQQHLRETHQCVSSNAAGNYEDKTGEFAQEIKDKITECFGGKKTQRSVQCKKHSLHSQQVSPKLVGTKSRAAQSPVQFETRPTHVPLVERKVTGTKSQHKPSLHDRLARIRQDHCWRLVRNVKNLGRIQCKQCDVTVSFSTTQHDAPARLRAHIFSKHLPKLAVYRCRLCPFKTAVYSSIGSHFKRVHNSPFITGKFQNHENDFHDKIISELSACFDSSGFKCTSENARSVMKRTHLSMSKHHRPIMDHHNCVDVGLRRNKLPSAASHHEKNRDPFVRKITDQCTKLIRRTPTRGQTIECQLCSRVLAKHDNNKYIWSVIQHVEAVHLRKDIYGCRHCHRRFVSIRSMTTHLRGEHKLAKITGQYVYFAEENHEALILLLMKCFDREFADSNGANLATTAIPVSTAASSGPTPNDSPSAKGKPEDDGSNASTSKEILTTRLNRYKCQVCQAAFVYELIYKKHMALFHSGAF